MLIMIAPLVNPVSDNSNGLYLDTMATFILPEQHYLLSNRRQTRSVCSHMTHIDSTGYGHASPILTIPSDIVETRHICPVGEHPHKLTEHCVNSDLHM
jgi:hypothetical protein